MSWATSCRGCQSAVALSASLVRCTKTAAVRTRYVRESFLCVRFGKHAIQCAVARRLCFGESTAASLRVAVINMKKTKAVTKHSREGRGVLRILNLGGRTETYEARATHAFGRHARPRGGHAPDLHATPCRTVAPGAVHCMTLASFQARCRRLGTNTAARSATSCRPPEATTSGLCGGISRAC